MRNLWRQFQQLLPSERRLYVEVVQVRGDGTSIVRTGDGRQFRAKGDGIPVGSHAFVVGDRIDGPAPDLPTTQETV